MKLGSLIWMGIKEDSLSEREKKDIQEEEVSGIILFKRNIKSLPKLFKLCQEIKSLKPAPLIMMDREGGLVDRLRDLSEYPSWPAPEDLVKVCSLKEIEQSIFYQALELKALGICTGLSPALDIPSVFNPLFKGRLLGKTLKQITKRALAYMKGLKKAGLATSAKHFPGHGGVREDSHFNLPIDQRDFKSLKALDLIPFQKAIDFDVDIIMTAHVLYPKMDFFPATLSEFFLKKVLREEMKFKKLILSDDLDMGALDMGALKEEKSPKEEVMADALLAGVDILLNSKPLENLKELLEKVKKVLSLKLKEKEKDKPIKAVYSGQKSSLEKKPEQKKPEQKNLDFFLEEKLFRLREFKQRYGNIKPLSHFSDLEKSKQKSAHSWCKELKKRIKSLGK